MLQRLILKNFKAFSGRTTIPFGRLTLIFGRNSSGKSSIIQSLMFLRQSMSDIDRAGLTISQGALTNLGSGKQVLTGQNADTECEITPIYDMATMIRNFAIPNAEGDAFHRSVGAGYLFHLEQPNIELTVRERRYYADGHDHVASTEGENLFSPVSVPARRRQNTRANPDATEVMELFAEFGEELARSYVENIEAWKLLILEALNLDDGRDLRDALLGAGEDFFLERSDDASFAGSGTINSWIEFLRFSSPNPGPGEEDPRHRSRLLRDLLGEVPEGPANAAPILPAVLRVHLETAFGALRNKFAEMSIELFATELVAMRLRGSHRMGRPRSSSLWAGNARNRFVAGLPPQTVLDQIRKRLPILDILPFVARATNRATVNLRYIGPVRSQGLRFDEVRNLPDRDVGKDGRNAIQLIADDEGLRTQANAWMERLGIMYRMEPVRIETGLAPLLAARIIDARNNLELNLVDVGFGISQVAPVVVQSLLLASQTRGREEGRRHQRDTLLVEQPELHLHPAMQAELGSLFAEVVSASSTAQIIAETHSEALILRVMKLIRTGNLDASLVKVLWVDQDNDGHAFARDLPIDASGEFEVSWPRGFFSERYSEMEDY